MDSVKIKGIESNLVRIMIPFLPDFQIEEAKPEVWVSVDTRPLNRKVSEFLLSSWFRWVHHGRLLEAGFPVQTLSSNSDTDDDGLYD